MIGPNLSEWAIKRRSLIVYFMIAAIVAGTISFLRLGRAEDPIFTFRTMIVFAAWPGASIEETLLQVTERIERKLQETRHLDRVRSYTTAGVTTMFVDLKQSTPPGEVRGIWQQVRNNVGDIRGTLPQGTIGPGFNDDFGDTYGIIYGFSADGFTHRELRNYVEDARSRLLAVPDVSKIEIIGAQDENIFLEFSTARLAGIGLSYSALLGQLQAQNLVRPAGVLQTGDERIFLRVSGAFDSEDDIKAVNIVVGDRLVPLTDIAQVRRGFSDPPLPLFHVNGKAAIGLAIAMRDGGDILALGTNLKNEMADIRANLPLGIDPFLVSDQAVTVDLAINDFMTSLWQAILIILAASFVSLGVRPGSVVALAIPLTLAIVFAVMEIAGIDLQRISLGALIIALTLLVDDAMTTVDAMIRRLAAGDSKEVAATFAYKTLAAPMLSGTLITIAGFVPIGFALSSAGEYTFSIFAVVAIALVTSWLVAVTMAPVIGIAILKPPKGAAAGEQKPGRLMGIYTSFLTGAMRAKWLTIAVTIAAFVAALYLLRFVPAQFFPASDRPELVVDLSLRQNASIYASEDTAKRLEAALAKDEDIDHWSTYVGRGAIRFYLPLNVQLANPFFAQVVIVTKGFEERKRVHDRLEKLLAEEFPDVVGRVSPLELGPPVGWPVQYRVSGPDKDEVTQIAQRLAQVVAANPGARHVNFDWMEPARQLKLRIDQDQARQIGVSSATIAATLNASIAGSTVTQVRDDIYLVNVVARARRRGARGRVDPARAAGADPRRTHGAAQPVRELRVRGRVPARVAPRPGADAHRARGHDAGRAAGHRRRRARGADRRAREDPAEGLPHRPRRHRRGKRDLAGVGVRGGAADDPAHGHRADAPAAELQGRVRGARRAAAQHHRRRARAARLQPAARLRRHPRHPVADRDGGEERGDPGGADRDRPRGRQDRLGRGDQRGELAASPAEPHCVLDRARPHPDRADGVLGADGVRDHGRPADRDAADARVPADALHHRVRRQAGARPRRRSRRRPRRDNPFRTGRRRR